MVLQRDINRAIAWWMDTGIHFKVESDIQEEYGLLAKAWQRPKIRGKLPLGFSHVAPSFIIFGVAIFISIIVLIQEISHHLSKQHTIKKKRTQRKPKRTMAQLARSAMGQPQIPKKAWA